MFLYYVEILKKNSRIYSTEFAEILSYFLLLDTFAMILALRSVEKYVNSWLNYNKEIRCSNILEIIIN